MHLNKFGISCRNISQNARKSIEMENTDSEIILLCAGGYLKYSLVLRNI